MKANLGPSCSAEVLCALTTAKTHVPAKTPKKEITRNLHHGGLRVEGFGFRVITRNLHHGGLRVSGFRV